MPLTYKRTPDFRALIHKAGPDYVGVSFDRYKGVDLLACRVWRSTGTPGEYHSTKHGMNISPQDFAYAYHYIHLVLDGRYGDCEEAIQCFDMGHNRVFNVQRQEFHGVSLLAARVYIRNKDKSIRPTVNGLTVQPHLWNAVLPHVKNALDELIDMNAIAEGFENAALACARRQYSPFL